MVSNPHLLPQSSTSTMVCHPHVLPQSSTSSSSIRPINLQPTANEASHRIYRPTIPTNWSLNLLTQTIDLPQTTHIQPLQPRNGPPFVVGLIKLMATDNPPCPPYPQTHKHRTEVELLPQTTHLLPQTTHIQPLQPRNGTQFAVGLIQPMAHQLRRCPKVSNKNSMIYFFIFYFLNPNSITIRTL